MFKLPHSINWKLLFMCIVSITLAIYLTLFVFNSGDATSVEEVPRIDIPDGRLVGLQMQSTSGREIDAFLGIRYATPPVGSLRFKPPEDPIPWYQEKRATVDPQPCIQFTSDPVSGKPVLVGREDCLRLNVFSPKDRENSKLLPVLVYIHGGGLYQCSSTIQDYGPQLLLNEDIVLVTFNYRLDVLGFLSTEDEEAPGNNGFKDQVAALKWVKKNIKHFGGDPEQVTIYGHSAGGYSVQYHMLSPLSVGLFQKAISSSGTIYTLYPYSEGLVAQRTRLLGEYVKCPIENSTILIRCLQNLHVESLFTYLHKFKVWGNDPKLIFGPVVESEKRSAETKNNIVDETSPFITSNSLKYSNVSVPWITGMTSADGLINSAGLLNNTELLNLLENKFCKLAPMIFRYGYHKDKEMITNSLKPFYFGEAKISINSIPQLTNTYTDTHHLFGILKSLTLHRGPVYLYYFTHRGQFSGTDDVTKSPPHDLENEILSFIKKGVSHGDELQFIFPMMKSLKYKREINFSKADETVSKEFIQLLTDFISQRDLSKWKWKISSLQRFEYMHLDTNGFVMEENLLHNRSSFWLKWAEELKIKLKKN